MREFPKQGERYRHFKGNEYEILSLATDSEDGEEQVVYKALYEPYGVFVRPLKMFMEPVDKEKYPDATQEFRFEKVEKIEGKVDPRLLAFLEAEGSEGKLAVLKELEEEITSELIIAMGLSLDIEVLPSDVPKMYAELVKCIETIQFYEGKRLRE